MWVGRETPAERGRLARGSGWEAPGREGDRRPGADLVEAA